ncbi:tyrosine-type recombinase/integrase [Actinokineospora globicatena]|uniref:tyrosine-type recombinase/integrase n=1 Tax=Actinokineospora globicatena TaxID=103729 RepID=UPI0020A2360D|nr:tyrosine-type recombinase/integrase [Actinokineospora globicatena]MCP2301760.1 Phage integrase family protein [Actinokineospora globicatena]GLW76582.1 integrase [Actinokineospora globicatena]GLW83416.1 integrase [Actinokineospora globicatena]
MKPTRQVHFWSIKVRAPRKDGTKYPRPYGVRWVTAGREHSEWFPTKALAINHLSDLQAAAKQGEAFDIPSGLPESMYRAANSRTLLQVVQRFIDIEWDDAAPNTRRRYVDALATAVGAFLHPSKSAPDAREIRRALTMGLLPSNARDVDSETAEWVITNSRPVADLADKVEVTNLIRALGRNLDGKPAAAWTTRTRRGTLHHALDCAVDLGELGKNPLDGLKTKSKGNVEVDPRVVANPAQARQLLSAVTYVGRLGHGGRYDYLYAFFATLYYAGLRPAEANRLRLEDCTLPETGWGQLVLSQSASLTTPRYSDTGDRWEERVLKRRAEGAVRVVPIPPQLVAILREHIERFGTTWDGRLFRGLIKGEPVTPSVYTDVWKRARVIALGEQARSPLAKRPYDLRHAAVSMWLAAGVPVAEVAERAGHTVDVLLKVYAQCLDGQRGASNSRIDAWLG